MKIKLTDATSRINRNMDFILSYAEEGKITLFARIEPFRGWRKDFFGLPIKYIGAEDIEIGPEQIDVVTYMALLRSEAAFLRTEKPLVIKIFREEESLEGVMFGISGERKYFLYFDVPKIIDAKDIFLNDDDLMLLVAPVEIPSQKLMVQEKAILFAIREQGKDPKKLKPTQSGRRGSRFEVRESMKKNDLEAYLKIFPRENIFDTAWQRLRSQGEICEK